MLQTKNLQATEGKINIAVILLRHISNFTDFNVLERDPRVHLFYTNNTEEIKKADILIIPGSKNTIADLYELRKNGVAQSIIQAKKDGATVIGICGGYQMMGQNVCDPQHIEGDIDRMPGLGLLPISTEIGGEKVTRQVKFSFRGESSDCHGYEIHMGVSMPLNDAKCYALNRLDDGTEDGCLVDSKCFGTYIHGILDNKSVIDYILSPYSDKLNNTTFDYQQFKENQYDKLADHIRQYVDMSLVYKIIAHD